MQHTQELSKTGTTRKQETSGGIEIRTELGKGSDFTVLGEVQLKGTSKLLHDLAVKESALMWGSWKMMNTIRLGSGTDTGDRKTDVDSRADTTEEEFSFQEDLTVSDGNNLDRS